MRRTTESQYDSPQWMYRRSRRRQTTIGLFVQNIQFRASAQVCAVDYNRRKERHQHKRNSTTIGKKFTQIFMWHLSQQSRMKTIILFSIILFFKILLFLSFDVFFFRNQSSLNAGKVKVLFKKVNWAHPWD